jgi:S1-C subfamily serine protease
MKANGLRAFAIGLVFVLVGLTAMPAIAITNSSGGRTAQLIGLGAQTKSGITAVEGTGLGVKITQVTPGKPCANAGLEVGDLIIAVNGQPITPLGALDHQIALATGNTPFIVQDHNTGQIVLIIVVFP